MIEDRNVTKKFEDFVALNDMSCNIPNGCIYGMVGSNGAGKSTFLRLLTGVYKPDKGSIIIDEQPVYENPKAKAHIAYVPDELYFLPNATLDRMSKLYESCYENFDRTRYKELVDAFRLAPNKSLNTFSKGMKRQASTILALSCKPDYLFFDETFDGLDPVMRNLVKSIICSDVTGRNATAIITSHSLRELEDTCDQLALLHKGGLVLESDIDNLKTSLFKIQIAFGKDFSKEDFTDISMLHFSKKGSVANIIAKGDKEATITRLRNMQPLILDVLPLSLEEVFTYEMEALGYSFSDIIEA